MIIAAQLQPGIDVTGELQSIDELADRALQWPVSDASSLLDFLVNGEGYTGNTKDYYNLSNSLLNQVISNKRGIPVTLALVYISVVERLNASVPGLNARGINFPAHFLLAVTDTDGEHLIDPFTGQLVNKQDCYNIIEKLYGQAPAPDAEYFRTADNRQLLRRVLENPKAIYLQTNNIQKAVECLDFQLMLYPHDQALLKQQLDLLDHAHSNKSGLTTKRLLQ